MHACFTTDKHVPYVDQEQTTPTNKHTCCNENIVNGATSMSILFQLPNSVSVRLTVTHTLLLDVSEKPSDTTGNNLQLYRHIMLVKTNLVVRRVTNWHDSLRRGFSEMVRDGKNFNPQ